MKVGANSRIYHVKKGKQDISSFKRVKERDYLQKDKNG